MEKYTIPEPNSGCFLWIGAVNAAGYGRIRVAGKTLHAHRVAWELAHGPIPPGKHILHHCDNPPCVRTDGYHLFLGDHAANMADKCAKGRYNNGHQDFTHCPVGHPYTTENTMRNKRGWRRCRTCAKRHRAAQYKKRKEKHGN